MAQRPQSWLHNTLGVWFGYFLTAAAAVPSSALGLFLISRGVNPQTAVLISIILAVLGGFVAERVIRLQPRGQKRLVISMPGLVLVVSGVPARPNGGALSSGTTTAASASLILWAA